ncbi:MAG: hypothetical protein PV358_02445, partial [Acidimicrobiales bacterium]|nr:hypothetical protein [Acidimicrobiales bacterium]
VDMAGEDVAFRRSLTPGWPYDDDVAGSEVKAAVADLVDWLGHLDTSAVAEQLRDRFVANRTPLLDGQLLEIAGIDDIDDGTVVVRRTGTVGAARLDPPVGDPAADRDARLRLTLGDRQVVMPAALEPAVRRLLDGSEHRVGDLADLCDGPSRLVLVRRLVREGALRTRVPRADG